MRNPRSTKRQREQDRVERANRKKQRREDRSTAVADEDAEVAVLHQDEILDQLAELHAAYAAGTVGLEDFETARAELTSRIQVD